MFHHKGIGNADRLMTKCLSCPLYE